MTYLTKLTFSLCILLSAVVAAEAAFVIQNNGNKLEGSSIRMKRDGTVVIETEKGPVTLAKGQYRQAVADKPASFDQARKMVAGGKYAQAIPLLEKIVVDLKNLGWDQKALELLPKAYSGEKEYAKAAKAYEDLFRLVKEPGPDAELGYFEALLQSGETAKLKPKLDEAISKSDRRVAARAQLLRGDMLLKQQRVEDALLDYLRTAILFKAQKDVQPEALFKTAQAMEQLRDGRAKTFYGKVVSQYPTSPYAAKAKAKL